MNWRLIIRYIGFALLASALFMLLSVAVSVFEGFDSAFVPLSISFLITFIVGIFPFIFVRRSNNITLREGYVIITLSWLLSFLFGMLPYVLWGGPFTIGNAIFESVSGFTTCGATILDDVEILPRSLMFWRMSTHFIGGLGVVVFLLLVIPGSTQMRMRLINMELSSLSRSGYASRPTKVVNIFAYVYLSLFVLATCAYLIADMSPFDAVCHAMSVVATGGFSTRTASIAAFDSVAVEAVSILFMLLSSVHFGLLFMAVISHSFRPLNSPVIKFYLAYIVIFTVMLSAGLGIGGFTKSVGESLRVGLFSTVSVASTTGFAIADNAQWPAWLMVTPVMAALVCGTSGSTTGGIKSDRVVLFFKFIGRHVKNILHPSSVNEVRMGKRVLSDHDVVPHILFIGIYALALLISSTLCIFSGMDPDASLVSSVMCMSNAGPACGELGNFGSYASVPVLSKLLLSFDMFLGRVEIYPILAVVAMIFDRKR